MAEFLAVEKKSPVPGGFMLPPGSPEILGDVHTLDEELVSDEIAVGIVQGRLAGPDGLDFRSGELDPGDIGLQELVVE